MERKMEKIEILLKKSCYIMDFLPERIEQDVLLVFDRDCLNLSVYNPAELVQSLMKKIAFS